MYMYTCTCNTFPKCSQTCIYLLLRVLSLFCIADSLRYQSITIQPEYRHLSFEELRFATKGKRRRSKKDQKKEGEELNQAHYLMLELFLSSEVFRSDVRKLVIMTHPLLTITMAPFTCIHVQSYSTSQQKDHFMFFHHCGEIVLFSEVLQNVLQMCIVKQLFECPLLRGLLYNVAKYIIY